MIRGEVIGGWRKLHTEELHNLYSSKQYKFVETPEGKITVERPRRKWKGNIKMDLSEIGWNDVDWTLLSIETSGGLT
jgi:hypothetical protein